MLMGEKKLAQQAKKGRFWGVLRALGELFRAWVLMEANRAIFVALVGPRREWGGLAAVSVGSVGACPPEKSHVIRLNEVSTMSENVAIPTV